VSCDRDWAGWGGNIQNNRWAAGNHKVSSCSIKSLAQHCRLGYKLGVSATPVVAGSIVYYPTWNGLFVALDYTTCRTEWEVNVTQIISQAGPITTLQAQITNPVSRSSPQIDGDVLFFGTLTGALLVALDRRNGQVLDTVKVNSHELAVITQSPTFYGGRIFIGASSSEGSAKRVPGYQCCSFVGNIMAVEFDKASRKFSVQWDLPMLPLNADWSGVAVWGSQPTIDTQRNQMFFGTGNLYTNPPEYDKCATANDANCYPPDVLQESVLAVDIKTGHINWINRIPPGPDVDFGMAPAFVPKHVSKLDVDVIVVGQKSGALYSIDASSGKILWTAATSPTGPAAGLSWGIAVDDTRAYFTAINSGQVTWTMQPSGMVITNSAYGAADLKTGALLWETQAPENSIAFGPPTVVGDVVLVARTGIIGPSATDPNYENTKGGLVALRKRTGDIVADVELDANFHGGIAVQGQYVMFGTGYSDFTNGTGSFYVMKVMRNK